jgi:hypothetical protein
MKPKPNDSQRNRQQDVSKVAQKQGEHFFWNPIAYILDKVNDEFYVVGVCCTAAYTNVWHVARSGAYR